MDRYTKNINRIKDILTKNGYVFSFEQGEDMELDDDEISLNNKISIQIDSYTGVAVAVVLKDGDDFIFFDIDNDNESKLIAQIKKAEKYEND